MDKKSPSNSAYLSDPEFQAQLDPVKSTDEANSRGNWSNKMDFVLSCLSYAVGLGNVWRFPYLCYRNGGGAFLIPFIVMLFVTGIPLVFLELSFGQYASEGVVSIWKVSPIFQGVGWAMFIVSVLIAIYYNMIIAWTLYYLFASFTAILPWSYCGSWSTPICFESRDLMNNCTTSNGTWYNSTCYTLAEHGQTLFTEIKNITNSSTSQGNRSPSDEYFHNEVLDISAGVHEMGGLRWQLALCLLLAWVFVCICLARGIKTSGKVACAKFVALTYLMMDIIPVVNRLSLFFQKENVDVSLIKAVYFTAFFPYIVLTILLVRGLTLEGSTDGILYYITPKWELLASAKVWGDAAVQIFFSLSPCWGGLITLASYNKFNNNCFLDAIIVSIMDCATSVFAGLVIFSIIGYMAHELQQPIDSVAQDGPGLAFVAYPEVVTKLPISQLWAVLFFAMLITLGLGTQIATVTTVHTTLMDRFPTYFRGPRNSVFLLFGIASACYLIGLAFCSQGGMYVLQLFDNYAATYSLLIIGLVECIALAWVYGADKMLTDIESMLGWRPHQIWVYSWRYVAPIALMMVLIFTWIDFKRTSYAKQVFPEWADGIGCLITLSSVLAIPLMAVFTLVKYYRKNNMSFLESIRHLSKPTPEWGPALKEHRAQREAMNGGTITEAFESQVPLTGHKISVTDTKC